MCGRTVVSHLYATATTFNSGANERSPAPVSIARCDKLSTRCRGHPGAPPGNRDPAMRRRGAGMPLGDHGTTQSMIAICKYVWHRPSDTPAVQHANASSHGIYDMRGYDTRGESACISIRLIEIRSMASERAGRGGRFPSGYARTSHAWMRLPRSRRKYSTHEQIPTPLVGHSRGARPSPHITPISDPFPGDSDSWGYVPGPLTGDIGRGPSTVARSPGRTPPNSQRRNAHSRCVVGWVESGYVERGAHDTRSLSSCLVRSPGNTTQFRGGCCGR